MHCFKLLINDRKPTFPEKFVIINVTCNYIYSINCINIDGSQAGLLPSTKGE